MTSCWKCSKNLKVFSQLRKVSNKQPIRGLVHNDSDGDDDYDE